jgi:plastocyanin
MTLKSSPNPTHSKGTTMTTNNHKPTPKKAPDTTRYLIVAALVAVAFFGAYRYASASNSRGASGVAQAAGLAGAVPAAGGAAGGGGGCCGGGGAAAAPVTGAAKVEGGVQKISVDVARTYNPNVIQLKAGVPAEITFSQAQGCTAIVQSSDLGFNEDLSSGPKTVKLKGLSAGTYNFACGMNMVRGTIVVQ